MRQISLAEEITSLIRSPTRWLITYQYHPLATNHLCHEDRHPKNLRSLRPRFHTLLVTVGEKVLRVHWQVRNVMVRIFFVRIHIGFI
jgi:hypothetical protein